MVDADSDIFSVVSTDDARGGSLAATHLLGLGHRVVGYLIERQVTDYDSQARRRLDGFTRELDAVGARLQVAATSSSLEHARVAARDILSAPERPTAIMAHYDELALGAMLAARDLGLAVPADVSIMGYDDGPSAATAGLSTVRQPFVESGIAAVQVLRAAMRGSAGPRTVTMLDCTLVARQSTASVSASTSIAPTF